jgi:hypothetical protein
MMAFTPGWLENQSIWMHMSYKYYLELLRGKLFDQFFSEMRGGGMFLLVFSMLNMPESIDLTRHIFPS